MRVCNMRWHRIERGSWVGDSSTSSPRAPPSEAAPRPKELHAKDALDRYNDVVRAMPKSVVNPNGGGWFAEQEVKSSCHVCGTGKGKVLGSYLTQTNCGAVAVGVVLG